MEGLRSHILPEEEYVQLSIVISKLQNTVRRLTNNFRLQHTGDVVFSMVLTIALDSLLMILS